LLRFRLGVAAAKPCAIGCIYPARGNAAPTFPLGLEPVQKPRSVYKCF
jgi:hypothetical protein